MNAIYLKFRFLGLNAFRAFVAAKLAMKIKDHSGKDLLPTEVDFLRRNLGAQTPYQVAEFRKIFGI